MTNGLLVVLEGIDGSGTSTQARHLHSNIKTYFQYADVLTTAEPWKNEDIRRILRDDKDAYSNGERCAELYIFDRKEHQKRLILPALREGVIVISDRHAYSTYVYQGAQGVPYKKLVEMHEAAGIIKPNITFFLDVDYEIAAERLKKRKNAPEKFEEEKFMREAINNYRVLYNVFRRDPNSEGRIFRINGNQEEEKVASEIFSIFSSLNHFRG